jgi:hypothetical protein
MKRRNNKPKHGVAAAFALRAQPRLYSKENKKGGNASISDSEARDLLFPKAAANSRGALDVTAYAAFPAGFSPGAHHPRPGFFR